MEKSRKETFLENAVIVLLVTLFMTGVVAFASPMYSEESDCASNEPESYIEYVDRPLSIDMDILAKAIIHVESRGNDKAVGDKGLAIGCMQIQPIYLKEVNNLLGYDKYKLSDRYNRAKSIEMFKDMNKLKNPKGFMHMAIKLHNPKAGFKYHYDIEEKYFELLEDY